jgi:pimeloyl-ACP methyl ester carboxylesterase
MLVIVANLSGHLLALPLAEEFMDEYTLISLSVPPVSRFSETAEGLKEILDYENVTSCDVIGHSNGGAHLQNLISKYPERVNKIIFSHTLTSMNKNDAYTINASEVIVYKKMRKLLKVLPVSLLTLGLQKMVLPKLQLKSSESNTKKLKALFKEDIKKITKQVFLTIADCMEDFLFNYTFTTKPYIHKSTDILIIDSPTDKVANPMQRAQMLRLCPGAREYHFKTGGHITIINCKEEYFSVLRGFLEFVK